MAGLSIQSAQNIMEFKRATDRLGALGFTHAELAKALDLAPATVRAARLKKASASHRKPPVAWATALAELARKRASDLEKLAEELEG